MIEFLKFLIELPNHCHFKAPPSMNPDIYIIHASVDVDRMMNRWLDTVKANILLLPAMCAFLFLALCVESVNNYGH